MANIYDAQGAAIPVDALAAGVWDRNVKAVAHRGFSADAPENTLPAYRLAREKGFEYVETDVSFTMDGVPVCLHDSTVDRTSTGSGNIGSLTLSQVKSYDFGAWKDSAYRGTRIPTLEEFLLLCRSLGLHPYIELKQNGSYTQEQIRSLVDLAAECGMRGRVTWISFSAAYLGYVRDYDPEARLGYVVSSVNSGVISAAQALRTEQNQVFVDAGEWGDAACNLCRAANLPLEVWTVDSGSEICAINPYITGVTSNSLLAGQVLHQAAMG